MLPECRKYVLFRLDLALQLRPLLVKGLYVAHPYPYPYPHPFFYIFSPLKESPLP